MSPSAKTKQNKLTKQTKPKRQTKSKKRRNRSGRPPVQGAVQAVDITEKLIDNKIENKDKSDGEKLVEVKTDGKKSVDQNTAEEKITVEESPSDSETDDLNLSQILRRIKSIDVEEGHKKVEDVVSGQDQMYIKSFNSMIKEINMSHDVEDSLATVDTPKDSIATVDTPKDSIATVDTPEDSLPTVDTPKDSLPTVNKTVDFIVTADSLMESRVSSQLGQVDNDVQNHNKNLSGEDISSDEHPPAAPVVPKSNSETSDDEVLMNYSFDTILRSDIFSLKSTEDLTNSASLLDGFHEKKKLKTCNDDSSKEEEEKLPQGCFVRNASLSNNCVSKKALTINTVNALKKATKAFSEKDAPGQDEDKIEMPVNNGMVMGTAKSNNLSVNDFKSKFSAMLAKASNKNTTNVANRFPNDFRSTNGVKQHSTPGGRLQSSASSLSSPFAAGIPLRKFVLVFTVHSFVEVFLYCLVGCGLLRLTVRCSAVVYFTGSHSSLPKKSILKRRLENPDNCHPTATKVQWNMFYSV